VYKARFKDGGSFYFFVLVEHQSEVDYGMPVRLLIYMSAIWRDELRKRKKKRLNKGDRLLPIFPIVLYNGAAKWTAAKHFAPLVDQYPMFSGYVPDFRYLLLDVVRYQPKVLRRIRNAIAAVFMLDRPMAPDELQTRLRESLDFLPDSQTEEFSTVVVWIVQMLTAELGEKEAERITEEITGAKTARGAKTMLAEVGAKLVKQGKAEGRAEGRVEGRVEEARKALCEVIKARFGARALRKKEFFIKEITSIRKLHALMRKAATAESADELGLG